MEVSGEQKRRIAANRAAALARRTAKLECPVTTGPSSTCVRLNLQHRSWALPSDVITPSWKPTTLKNSVDFQEQASVQPPANKRNRTLTPCGPGSVASAPLLAQLSGGFGGLNAPGQQLLNCGGSASEVVRVGLEICAPDRFSLFVKSGRAFQDFFKYVSCVARCENLEPSGQWPVYDLKGYDQVTEVLKGLPGVEYDRIPWSTRMVLEKFQRAAECGLPYGPNHLTLFEVDQLLLRLPPKLATTLLPFQREGVKYGLQRGGRLLLADEMGVGKTIQAIAIASCYRDEGSLLVVCPASLRLVWAEELERWLTYLSPLDVHLVFGRKNNLAENVLLPKVVVISFNMMARLRESMSSREWGMVIVDEAHNLRCTTKKLECQETMAVLELVQKVNRVVLLTGTPSLSRPFDIFNQVNCLWPKLLGKNKYEFARNYCDRQWPSSGQGDGKDFSKGARLLELNVLLKQAVMLSTADIKSAKAFTAATAREKVSERLGEEACHCGFTRKGACECEDEGGDPSGGEECEGDHETSGSRTSARILTEQEIGVAKLRGFQEWLLNNSIFAGRDKASQKKMIIFAHHLKVLNSIQTIVQSERVEFVRIDGSTLPRDRVNCVNRFRSDPEVKLAIIGVQAGGVGLDFSAAQSVTFVELPKSASEMLQAEDRAHRRGQKNSVNIYVFVAKGTADVRRWQSLSTSLERVSTMTDGAETSLEIHRVVDSSDTHPQANISQDSCITIETCGELPNFADHGPACSSQLRFTSSQFQNTPGGSLESSMDFPAKSLMFEVSSNTGRIHLFLRSDDESARPASLEANFKPEDLAHFTESGVCVRGALPACFLLNDSHREAAALFWKEYCDLRPFFRRRLRGRPLSLPLSTELESFRYEDQYIPGGIVKGGSKRRWTPREEVGSEIPAGACWRTISYRRRNDLKVTNIVQAWTANNVPLCKYCQQPCKGPRSAKPESFVDLFCQVTCLNEYSSKTNGRFIRQELFDLEGGVCVRCKLDCHALVGRIDPLPVELRRAYILENAPQFTECKSLLERLIKDPVEGKAWHADHIRGVADGGGECTLENFQTLCIACHAKVTAEQHRRRTSEKLQLKKSYQKTLKKLKERTDRTKRRRTIDVEVDLGGDYLDTSEDEDDQGLLNVNVAGSAYSASAVTEARTEHARNSIPLCPRTKRRQCAPSPEVALRACRFSARREDEGDQDLLIVNIAGSSYSASAVTEPRNDHACDSVLSPRTKGRRRTHSECSPEIEGCNEALAVRADKSMIRIPDRDIQSIEVAGSALSASGITVYAEDFSQGFACKLTRRHSSPKGLESTSEVRGSIEVLALQASLGDAQDTLKVSGEAGNPHSAIGILGISEKLTIGLAPKSRSILQPASPESLESTSEVECTMKILNAWKCLVQDPREDAHDTLHSETAGISHSGIGISDIPEELALRSCNFPVQPPCECALDTQNLEVAGDLNSDVGIHDLPEKLAARAYKPSLQPRSLEGGQSTHRAISSEVYVSPDGFAMRACSSLLQAPSDDDHEPLTTGVAGSSYSASGIMDVTERPRLGVSESESTLRPPSPEVFKPTYKSTSRVERSTETLVDSPCCKSTLCATTNDTRESTRFFKSSPCFPTSGEKPTFSLKSLDKYLLRPV